MARIDWNAAARGKQVIPVLLIHGVPAIFYPEGVSITGSSLSSTPAEWWPGNNHANWVSYGKPWINLQGDGVHISERAQPTQTEMLNVSEVTLHLSDHDGVATAFFSNSQDVVGTWLADELSAGAFTITVASTDGFPEPDPVAFLYLDQEAIAYNAKTATTFTVAAAGRGRFGSRAARHLHHTAQGTGLGNPRVLSAPDEVVGRPATLWLVEVTAGVVTAVQLEHFGLVGVGAQLTSGGGSDAWVVTLDHAIKRLAQPIRQQAINVFGYAHEGHNGYRARLLAPTYGRITPAWVRSYDDATGAIDAVAVLTGDSGPFDQGGWHASREEFVRDFDAAGRAAFNAISSNFSATLRADERLTISFGPFTGSHSVEGFFPWSTTDMLPVREGVTGVNGYSTTPMPKAWVPILNDSPVYLRAEDYANVPPVPSLSPDAAATATEAYFCLVFGNDDEPASRRVARITANTSSGGVHVLRCTALDAPRLTTLQNVIGEATGFILTEPTTARIGLYVKSRSWVAALRYAVEALDVEYASVAGAIDWDHMAAVASQHASVISPEREDVLDLDTTVLQLLANEAALNGFALVMHEGRVSIARIAEFAVTERTAGSLATADLHIDSPVPQYDKGADGIVNVFTVEAREAGVTVNVIDETSRARYGTQGTVRCVLPRGVSGTTPDAGALYTQVFAQAATVLGPHRYPYEHVTVRVPLHKYDLQVGDLVSIVALWRVPNGLGGRGIAGEVGQVVAREVTLYAEQRDGYVAYVLRLNPRNLTGYAPSALVAASGISGDVVTLDTTTFGADGFAGIGTDGGTDTFAVGDRVRLVEIDTTSPTSSTQHTVTAVDTVARTITLDPSPTTMGSWHTIATTSLKVMVIYDDWSVVASIASQARHAYLAGSSATLDASHPARIYAA